MSRIRVIFFPDQTEYLLISQFLIPVSLENPKSIEKRIKLTSCPLKFLSQYSLQFPLKIVRAQEPCLPPYFKIGLASQGQGFSALNELPSPSSLILFYLKKGRDSVLERHFRGKYRIIHDFIHFKLLVCNPSQILVIKCFI